MNQHANTSFDLQPKMPLCFGLSRTYSTDQANRIRMTCGVERSDAHSADNCGQVG